MTSNSDYNKLDDMFANSSDDDDVTSTPAALPTGRSRGRKPKPKKGGSRAGMLIYIGTHCSAGSGAVRHR